ncbi:hypothetical protein KCU62_g7781, partial [Aureobasidium sp. EXF-3399]
MFEQRALPTVHKIAEIFQRIEPRSYVPGVGPFLEFATGLATDDPLLMPEILRRLEVKMLTDTSLKDRDNPGINTTSSQLRHQPEERENTRNPFLALNEDGTVPEIDPGLDEAPPVRYLSAGLKIDPMLDAPSLTSVSSISPLSYTPSLTCQPTSEKEIDPNLDAPLSIRYPSSQMDIDSGLAPSSANYLPTVYQDHRYEDSVGENVQFIQDRNPPEDALAENSFSTCEPKSEDEEEAARPDVVVGEQIEGIADQFEKRELRSPELAELAETPAQQVELDVDMDHQDGINHTADSQPFYMIREESTGLGEGARRELSLVSDFSTFDEIMQEVQENPDEQHILSAISQAASDTESREDASAVLASAPGHFNIPDSFVISDDELEPDSNPYLAAYRAKQLASASASASTSNAPASSAPVVCLPDVARRAGPRKSEPIVLVSSPVSSCVTQSQAEQPVPQRRSSRISDSMFVSDDSDDDIPPTSNPHLAALIRAKASASAPRIAPASAIASAPTSGSSTPSSSASTSKSTRPKLPPHLARVRRAAHRQSLDPSSQVPTPEERQLLDQEEYPLIDIIDERTIDGEKKYLIKWKPIHGRKFLDTWEPAENANAASVEDWELQKAKKGKRKDMEHGKVKKVRRGTGRERRERPVERSVAVTTIQTTQEFQEQHQSAPLSSPEQTPMFFVDTAGDASLASRGTRFVPTLHIPSPSPEGLSSIDQVSSRTRSRVNDRDDTRNDSTESLSDATPIESVTNLTPEPAADRLSRYAARPFSFDSVSAEPQPIPAASSLKPNNSDKYKTPAQQKTRMREKRAIRRAEKAARLANMTEKQRAEHEHSKKMHKRAKAERRRTKAERLAAMPEEERQELENWLEWKRALRQRIKDNKQAKKAGKARRREEEARRVVHNTEQAS